MVANLPKTPIGRLSFPSLFTKKPPMDGKGEAYYEATMIWPRGMDLSELETAIEAAAEKKWGNKAAVMKKKVRHWPIKSNEECTDNEGSRRAGYEDSEGRYAKFKTSNKPKVVGREKDPQTGGLLELTKDEVYAGSYGRISYTVFAGEHGEGGPYIRLTLQNYQFVGDGEPFSGIFTDPADDFAEDPAVLAAMA